jgi:hypothetical protein
MARTKAHAPAKTRLYSPRVFSKRTKQRFLAERTAELIRGLHREPSYPERIIIARCVAIEWDLRRTDFMLDQGSEPSGHMLRARLAGENRLRLDLAALGIRPGAPPQPSLADLVADMRHRKGAAA